MGERDEAGTAISPATEPASPVTSIEARLPLIIGALLLVVIVALAGAAWIQARRSALHVAEGRLSAVTTQFRDLFRQSLEQIRERIAPAGRDPAIVAFVARDQAVRRRASDATALAALRRLAAQPEQVLATELRDARGRVLLTTAPNDTALAALSMAGVLPRASDGAATAAVGRFLRLRDTLVYPVVVPVQGAGDAIHVVHWRKLVGSQRTREQFTRLIGSDASIYVGNASGEGWSDLERPVPRPPFAADSAQVPRTYDRDGHAYMADAALIPGAPWMVALDLPRATVMAPVNAFVRQLAIIAFAALVLGLAAAWLVSRRITRPLRQLTHAAEEMAAGDYSQTVTITSRDELGRLGAAFTTMARQVSRSHDTLEHRVQVRTQDLNRTLGELHEAQEALVRRERLAMLGQLSSGVGHELRNPLGVMTNAVYYLRTVLGGTAAPKVREYLDILQQQITVSEKIVADLLDFARAKPPQRQPTDVKQVTLAQLARLGPTNGMHMDVDVPDEVPRALADPTQLGQVVLNLLTNAVQALNGSGHVVVRARQVDGRVEYEVSDDGPGVPPQHLEKVFEPLFTTKARGIGLGLAVSRTLARANGGDLTCRSTPGEGATFTLTLPVAEA